MRVKLITHRKLYYVLVAALFLVVAIEIVNEEISAVRLIGEPWIGFAVALLLIGLFALILIDREIARQMLWPAAPFQPYQLSERAIVSAVRVMCRRNGADDGAALADASLRRKTPFASIGAMAAPRSRAMSASP
jgi:hypothetical protein